MTAEKLQPVDYIGPEALIEIVKLTIHTVCLVFMLISVEKQVKHHNSWKRKVRISPEIIFPFYAVERVLFSQVCVYNADALYNWYCVCVQVSLDGWRRSDSLCTAAAAQYRGKQSTRPGRPAAAVHRSLAARVGTAGFTLQGCTTTAAPLQHAEHKLGPDSSIKSGRGHG